MEDHLACKALPHVASAWHITVECCGYLRVHKRRERGGRKRRKRRGEKEEEKKRRGEKKRRKGKEGEY